MTEIEPMKVSECTIIKAHSADEETSVLDIAKTLKKHQVRHLTITKDGAPVGIVSAVDIVNNVVAAGKDPKDVHGKDIMTSPIITCNGDDSAFHTYVTMAEKNIMACPVVVDGKLNGMVGIQNLMTCINKRAQEMGCEPKQ